MKLEGLILPADTGVQHTVPLLRSGSYPSESQGNRALQ